MKKIAPVLALVGVLAFPAASIACHRTDHEVTATVDCTRGIRLDGRGFAKADFPLALDGPGEYELVLHQRPATSWHERVPVGADGTYTLMWASGFAQFSVECGL